MNKTKEKAFKKIKFKKGQTYSIEIVFFVIICLILIYSLFSIYTTLIKLNSNNKNYIMAWSDSELLVKTRGLSPDWEETGNLSVLGLANGKNVIEPEKLVALSLLPDQNISYLLHLYIYNVSIQILVDGNVYFEKGNVSSNKTVNQVERICVFTNGTPCMLRLRYSME